MKTSELTEDEINKTIAGYMGEDALILESGKLQKAPLYTRSLDSLVPVWQRLSRSVPVISLYTYNHSPEAIIRISGKRTKRTEYGSSETTIQMAAALATARAILETEK